MTEAELCEALNVADMAGLKSIVDYAKGLRDGRNNRPPHPDQGPLYDDGFADGQKLSALAEAPSTGDESPIVLPPSGDPSPVIGAG